LCPLMLALVCSLRKLFRNRPYLALRSNALEHAVGGDLLQRERFLFNILDTVIGVEECDSGGSDLSERTTDKKYEPRFLSL
jgi:hypothetical protein